MNQPEITLLFAMETCNAEDTSEQAESALSAAGFPVNRLSIADMDLEELRDKPVVLIIASTGGEGDPPTEAEPFYDDLIAEEPLELTETHFSILALGTRPTSISVNSAKTLTSI